jgi:sugar phosphate isomerase/epimerase
VTEVLGRSTVHRENGGRTGMTTNPANTRRQETPCFSISQISTLLGSFDDDLQAYVDAGLDGIGIWELKLNADGDDRPALEAFERSGLAAASAVPSLPSILPLPLLGGPTDPEERIESLCASIHRLAAFGPPGIVCLTGSGIGLDPDRAREIVIDGLRRIAAEAELAGVRIALEPHQGNGGAEWTIAATIPEAVELIAAAGGSRALGLQVDVWHLWNTPTVLNDIARHIDLIVGVHVCDVPGEIRGWADRVLPGDGIADVGALVGALDDAGWRGLYDLEIFSDNGAFGTTYPDSLWDVPAAELARRGHAALCSAWQGRRQVVPARMTNQPKEGA